MGTGWKIGRLAGIDLAIHPSWLVIFFLVTYSLAAFQFPREFAGWSQATYWIVGVATALLFFASVLAHELSHALVARRFGLRVEGITLFIFGGATSLDRDSRTPREEALIAVAGPLTSLAIGAALIGLELVVGQPQLAALVGWLGVINLMLGAFNLIPGFPMDGGRLLRAVVWRIRGDRLAATRNAAVVGRLFAYLLIAIGVYLALRPGGSIFSGLWLALIGWFLSNAAEATVAQAGLERSLFGVMVRDAMDRMPAAVSPNELVSELVSERMLRGNERSYLVRHADGGLAGLVTLGDVRRVPREQWPLTRVTDIMTRYADLATVRADAPVTDALRLLEEHEVGQLPVIEDEARTPVGVVSRRGILRLVEARMKLGL
ncbi:MAG TPA: site-2 protease family protein [Candidatus Limnocylindria bacterium]|nr:site-2 protease family protein [Candidatus Limnocylindria bacterium]